MWCLSFNTPSDALFLYWRPKLSPAIPRSGILNLASECTSVTLHVMPTPLLWFLTHGRFMYHLSSTLSLTTTLQPFRSGGIKSSPLTGLSWSGHQLSLQLMSTLTSVNAGALER